MRNRWRTRALYCAERVAVLRRSPLMTLETSTTALAAAANLSTHVHSTNVCSRLSTTIYIYCILYIHSSHVLNSVCVCDDYVCVEHLPWPMMIASWATRHLNVSVMMILMRSPLVRWPSLLFPMHWLHDQPAAIPGPFAMWYALWPTLWLLLLL